MAAFCGCCGAEITSKKSESCPACGAPTHGMLLTDPLQAMEFEKETSQNKESGARSRPCEVHQTGKNAGG
jgi:hypothetical protein